VGIDLEGLKGGHKVRGIGVHTSELLKELKLKSQNSNVKVEEYDSEKKYDLVHYTVFKPFAFSVPFKKPAPKVVLTIHDLIPLVYPKHYLGGLRGNLRFFINKFLIKKNVDAIITISETSKKDICRFLEIAPEKVHVIYLAPRSVFKKLETGNWKLEIKKRYGLPEHFVLYVGDVNYNKNIPNLIKACRLAKLPLVVCGKQAKEVRDGSLSLSHPELRHLKKLDWEGVAVLGFVPNEELVKIYNLATVYVQPSFYEGFGLPVLEAVACGCPVVAARNQALVEILGQAANFVDPYRPEDIAEAIKKPIPAKKLPRDYSWEKAAQETLKIYAKA